MKYAYSGDNDFAPPPQSDSNSSIRATLAKRTVLASKTDIFRVLQVLSGPVSPIFGFFNICDALRIRNVCKDLRNAVSRFQWCDMRTRITNLDDWSSFFPLAIACNLGVKYTSDIMHMFSKFSRLTYLDLSSMQGTQDLITDAAFSHLSNLFLLTFCFINQICQ
jgi:hypothetical protein